MCIHTGLLKNGLDVNYKSTPDMFTERHRLVPGRKYLGTLFNIVQHCLARVDCGPEDASKLSHDRSMFAM